MKDAYEKFAQDYDEFGPVEQYLGAEKAFFVKLFSNHDVKTVLDCACGTGQHLYILAEAGYKVFGSDYSAPMLKAAQCNLEKKGLSIPLLQADFRCLEKEFDQTFDAVVCLTSSLPHLHTDDDLLLALRSMHGRLNEGGLLVLTQGTTHYTLGLPPIEVVVNRPDFSRVFVKKQAAGFQTIHVLDLYHSERRTESNQYDIVNRILLDDDYHRLLAAAGFSKVKIYGSYDLALYDTSSKRLIVVAEK